MSSVITIENLGKKYILSHQDQQKARYLALRDVMTRSVKNLGRKIIHPLSSEKQPKPNHEEFWALREISFDIRQGERLGIIGRNGAGKSTLLKILSRITEPTTGKVRCNGRVASLLEVGTGFHPELTGRENIFLNGAILGMSREEIKRKFDEIVDFAEVEKFLDTPVKRYSSGMYVRLAFAVAAHLETEILLVDEVLAVGDVQFQKKCLGKMDEVASDGKTVLLVSHNMATISSLSTKCILLDEGRLIDHGTPQKIIETFQKELSDTAFGQSDLSHADHYGNGRGRFLSISMRPVDKKAETLAYAEAGCDLEFELVVKAYTDLNSTTVALTIYDQQGVRIIDANTLIQGKALTLKKGDKAAVKFLLKNVRLKPGVYTAGLWLGIINQFDADGVRYATTFNMEASREDTLFSAPFPGIYACEFEHDIKTIDVEDAMESD